MIFQRVANELYATLLDEIKAKVVEEQSEDILWSLAGKCVACILLEVYPDPLDQAAVASGGGH